MTPLQSLIARLTFCGRIGGIVGPLCGALYAHVQASSTLSWTESLIVAAATSLVTWIVVLLIAGIWLRYGVVRIAALAAVTCTLVSFAVTILLHLVPLAQFALIVGFVVGIGVGDLVCRACALRCRSREVSRAVSLS